MYLNFVHIYYENFLVRLNNILGKNKKTYQTLLPIAAQFQRPFFTFYAMPLETVQWYGPVTTNNTENMVPFLSNKSILFFKLSNLDSE